MSEITGLLDPKLRSKFNKAGQKVSFTPGLQFGLVKAGPTGVITVVFALTVAGLESWMLSQDW